MGNAEGPFEYYNEIHAGVDGNSIRAAAKAPGTNAAAIQALAGELEGDEKKVAGQIEGDIEAGTKAEPKAAAGHAHDLAVKGTFAVALLNQFAGYVDTFDKEVDRINTEWKTKVDQRWGAALQRYKNKNDGGGAAPDKSAIEASVKHELQGEYDKAVTKLDDDADTIASEFKKGPTDSTVKALMESGYMPLSALSLFPKVHLTSAEKYKAYRAEIAHGLMPDFKKMTEAQRAAFVKANPDIVTYLMSIKKPDQQVITDVVSLVLPHVDGDDADIDAALLHSALNGYQDPEKFKEAFANVAGISSALATLSPWLDKHNLTVADVPAAKGAVDYLKTFAQETWPDRDKIIDYIKDDKHDWQFTYTVPDGTHYINHSDPGFSTAEQNSLMKTFANGFLGLSDERIGGGFSQMPKEMQEYADDLPPTQVDNGGGFPIISVGDNDHFKELAGILTHGSLQAGDDLSKHLASTAMTSNSMTDQYNSKQAGGPFDPWDDDLTGDIMHLVSKNHEATTDLLTGHDVPDNYYGNIHQDGTFPDNQDPLAGYYGSNFTEEMFGHDWKGDSEKGVADMVTWIHGAHASDNPHEVDMANKAFTGLANSITSTDGDTFKNLMGSGGESSAHNNRLLALGLADATYDHLGQIAAEDGSKGDTLDLSKPDAVRLMTYIASDHDTGDHQSAANRLSAYVAAYEHDRVNAWVHDPNGVGPRQLADDNGRLSAMLDSGLINEASERGLNANDAEAARVANLKIASGIVASLAGKIPVAGDVAGPLTGVGNTLIANTIQAQHLPPPVAGVTPEWLPDGSHVTQANTTYLVDALVEQGKIKPGDLPASLQHPDGQTNATLADGADQVLTKYFREHPVKDAQGNVVADSSFYDNYSTQMAQTYKGYNDFYGLTHKDSNQIKEFLTSKTWGQP